jgi:hypothetical protein
METVRGILAAHHSGISKQGLLAWARLRIDTAMTEAQLDEELARLGDEVVDVDGFLYLRDYVDPSRRPAGTGTTPPAPALTSVQPVSQPAGGGTWSRPAPPRVGRGAIGKVIGVGVFLWWLLSFIGGLIGPGTETTPQPTGGTTQPAGIEVAWTDLKIGECFTYSEEGGGSIRRLSCDQPHGYELIEIATHPSTAFPGDSAFATFAEDVCRRTFASYTGAWPEDQKALTWFWWSPSEAEWNDGIRTVDCMVAPADGSLTDRSYRGGL